MEKKNEACGYHQLRQVLIASYIGQLEEVDSSSCDDNMILADSFLPSRRNLKDRNTPWIGSEAVELDVNKKHGNVKELR